MMRNEMTTVVEAYLDGLRSRDLSNVPIADDVTFDNPISGPGSGAEELRAFLSGFLPAIEHLTVHRHFCDGDHVVTHWEADTVFGIISVLEMFRIDNGKIASSNSYFDPRPVLGC